MAKVAVNLFRQHLRRDPFYKKKRAEMAQMYRNIRQSRPDIARLLFKAQRERIKELSDKLFTMAQSPSGDGGLHQFLAMPPDQVADDGQCGCGVSVIPFPDR